MNLNPVHGNQSYDIAGHSKNNYMPNSFPENVNPHRAPRHPRYVTYDSRLESFIENGWPRSMPQKPEQLAMAGFFYEGKNSYHLTTIERFFYF